MRSHRIRDVVTTCVLGLLLAAPTLAAAQDATPAATPVFADTVTVDGRRLGLTCAGSGSPTVVLIGGLRIPADRVWPPIVAEVAGLTRVCVFERAGLGPSDPQPRSPQTAADVVADLHAALGAAGEAGPYVPVGFSVSGPFVRLYASTYPDEVAGLVVVEGNPPGGAARDLALGGFASEAEREAVRASYAGRDPELAAPIDQLASEAQVVAAPPPPPVPTVVLVRGAIDPEVPLEVTALWYELQAAQARELNARVVVAEESGHLVPLDQPEVVVAAIEDVVAAVRDPSAWATPVAGTPSP